MAKLHLATYQMVQILWLFPHFVGQGGQQWLDLNDRKPGEQDSYFYWTCKMASDEAHGIEMVIFHPPTTPQIQVLYLFQDSLSQGGQWWWDITDRKPGWNDSRHKIKKIILIDCRYLAIPTLLFSLIASLKAYVVSILQTTLSISYNTSVLTFLRHEMWK